MRTNFPFSTHCLCDVRKNVPQEYTACEISTLQADAILPKGVIEEERLQVVVACLGYQLTMQGPASVNQLLIQEHASVNQLLCRGLLRLTNYSCKNLP
jgi:hypothetical protein